MGKATASAGGSRTARRKKEYQCHLCGRKLPFCWTCRCGFEICPQCMEENKWGMAGPVTWICPDCGEIRGF